MIETIRKVRHAFSQVNFLCHCEPFPAQQSPQCAKGRLLRQKTSRKDEFFRGLNFYKLICIAFIFCSTGLNAQSLDLSRYKNEVDSLSNRLTEIESIQMVLSKQADDLAQKISRIKTNKASLLDERTLDAALQKSQILADSLQLIQQQQRTSDRVLRRKAEQLFKILNAEIENLTQAVKHDNSINKDKITQDIKIYHEWRKLCQGILNEPPPEIIIYEVHKEQDDDPATLGRKADFLRDQADRIEREVQRIKKKTQ